MSYSKFAYHYDYLMSDVPYEKWTKIVCDKKKQYEIKGNKVLDLACGTGSIAIQLAKQGFSVTGVDLSSEMLTVAAQKAEDEGQSIFLLEQDMAELDGLGVFDMIGIFCDSINYLQTEEEVCKTFAAVQRHLADDGLFLFDVHSLFKMNTLFQDQTYTVNEEDIALIWNCFSGEFENSVEHELTFFVSDPQTGLYNRFDEIHFQRTYPVEQYTKWLEQYGFHVAEIFADFAESEQKEEAERIFFVCQKKKTV